MNENNPYLLPRDVRFLIFQDFQPKDILNLSLVNKKCCEIFKDENFWMRKLYKDFPDLSFPNDKYFELYKYLSLRYSQTDIIRNAGYLLHKVIKGKTHTFVVNKDQILKIIKNKDRTCNIFKSYLISLSGSHVSLIRSLSKNVRDLILPINDIIYRIWYTPMLSPYLKNIKMSCLDKIMIQINNVEEIGEIIIIYIK